MTVYVESNFVIEQALQQEQCNSCDEIVAMARSGTLSLAIPAFSLAEPHQALAAKEKGRKRLNSELRAHLLELGRSVPYRTVPEDYGPLASILTESADWERAGLRQAIAGLLESAGVMPLNAEILVQANSLQDELGLSGQDALVFASVMTHLRRTQPTESCFLSRNSKDFDDPDIRERLQLFGCRYFASFDQALA